MNANTQALIVQYQSAKQAMIDGYRNMHQPPACITWNEVQDLQDAMQSAAVALAEHMMASEQSSKKSDR